VSKRDRGYLLHNSFKLVIVISLIIAIFILFLTTYMVQKNEKVNDTGAYLLFRNVGQGDSVLICDLGVCIVLDGGPANESLGLLPQNLCNIYGVLLTHPHKDHLAGLTRLLRLCMPEVVFYNQIEYSSRGYEEFIDLSSRTNVRTLHRGDSFGFGSFTFHVLWPPHGFETPTNINDTSIVILLDRGTFEVLFTGDISAFVQRELSLEAYGGIIQGDIDVYKVPHHGSSASFDGEFLLSLQPKLAIVSLGENSFGHPSPLFEEHFKSYGVRYMRTDEYGDIRINLKETL